jgi:hypothetical protein
MHRTSMGCLGLTFFYRPMQCSNMLHKICFINVKKCRKSLRKLSGIFKETFRKFSSLFILHSVSHMHRTPMDYLGLTFSYMQCSNMRHNCEEIQKKFTEIFRKLSGNFPETFRKFSETFRKLSGNFPESFRKLSGNFHH